MIESTDKPIEKQRRKFDEAAHVMAACVSEAGLRAVVHVISHETGAAEMPVRASVRQHSITRQVLDHTGRVAASVLRTALPDPWSPEAFNAAVFHVAKLMATAWRAGGGH